MAGTSVSVTSATTITATAPAATSAQTVDVTVTTPAGTSATGVNDQFAYGAPTVTKVAPDASGLSGAAVTITGTGFVPGATVKFGSVAGTSVSVTSATTITATAPAVTSGQTVDVTVTTPAGTSATGVNDLFAYGAPTVTKVAPDASGLSGAAVTITGTGFVPGATVEFGSVAGTSVTVTSATTITATAPAATSAHTVHVTVTTPAGTSATSVNDQFAYGAPTVTKVAPDASGLSGASVTITGTGFVPGATVRFGSVAGTSVSVTSATTITATAPAATSAQTVDVTVTTPAGTSATGVNDQFAYGAPTVSKVAPDASGLSGAAVTITGTGFVPGATVKFGSVAGTSVTVTSATTITATAPGATSAHTVHVTVTTPAGTSATSVNDQFAYGAPTVTTVAPNASGLSGGSATITGTGFVPGATVNFGSAAATNVTVTSATTITATAPAVTGAQQVNITVTTPAGTSNGQPFQYEPVPTVTGVSPNAGPLGGTNVTIIGTGFFSDATVKFGTAAATNVKLVSSTTITATAPAVTSGQQIDVTVHQAGGTSPTGSSDLFRYEPVPTVTNVSPSAVGLSGGSVTITGTGFFAGPNLKVSFGSQAGTNVQVTSATTITATAPSVSSAQTVDVTVHTDGGTSATTSADLLAYGSPAVKGLSPNAGPVAAGQTVTLTGQQLTAGAKVKFCASSGRPCATVAATLKSTSTSRTQQLTAVTPASPLASPGTGVVNVSVTTAAGASGTGGLQQQYAYGPPTISSFSPTTAPAGSTVTVTGANFVIGATAQLISNGGAATTTSATVVNSTTIKLAIPEGYTAVSKIKITTPARSATSTGGFTPDLAITAFSPASGTAGTMVTITGIGFNGGSVVKFNRTIATSVTHVSSTELRAKVPVGTTSGPLSATNSSAPAGTTESAQPRSQ